METNPIAAAAFLARNQGAAALERVALRAHAAPPPPPPLAPPAPPSTAELDEWEAMKLGNPVLAARYHAANAPKIIAAQRARRAQQGAQ